MKKALTDGIKGTQGHRFLAILASLERQQVEVAGPNGGAIEQLVKFVMVDA